MSWSSSFLASHHSEIRPAARLAASKTSETRGLPTISARTRVLGVAAKVCSRHPTSRSSRPIDPTSSRRSLVPALGKRVTLPCSPWAPSRPDGTATGAQEDWAKLRIFPTYRVRSAYHLLKPATGACHACNSRAVATVEEHDVAARSAPTRDYGIDVLATEASSRLGERLPTQAIRKQTAPK